MSGESVGDRSGFDSLSEAERVYVAARGAAWDGPVDVDALCAARPELAGELRRIHVEQTLLSAALGESLADAGRHAQSEGPTAPGPEPARDALERLRSQVAGLQASPLRYRFRRILGRGGMGVVLEHWDEHLQRRVAMKLVRGTELAPGTPASARSVDRLLEEARITGQLEHPGIVPLHDLGVDAQGRVYFTMRVVEGRDLHEVFRACRRRDPEWSLPRVVGVLQRACEAVAFAHSRGVIHRDLKPGNVMVGRFGETYVMDWGLARVVGAREAEADAAAAPSGASEGEEAPAPVATDDRLAERTRDGQRIGSPCYMSPEQARGDLAAVDRASDVYSLGAILYELLSGVPPYAETGADGGVVFRFFERIQVEPPRPLGEIAPDAPEELVAICERAMARAPEDRFPTVEALSDDLRAYLEGRVVKAHRTGAWVELRKWVRRNRGTAAAILAAGVIALVGGAGYLRQSTLTANVQRDRAAERQQSYVRSEMARAGEALRRGAFDEALSCVADLRAAGLGDALDLDLIRAEALLAKADHAACDEVLQRLERANPTGERLGHYLLIRADRMQADMGTRDQALLRVAEALAAGLDPASERYARALLEPTTTGALQALASCVELDPFHHRARALRQTLLFLTGRFAEAREEARIMARVYPDDPRPHLTLALIGSAEGDRAATAAAREALRVKTTAEEFVAAETAVRVVGLFRQVDAGMLLENKTMAMNGLMTSLHKEVTRSPSLEGFHRFLPPNLRCLELTYTPLLRILDFPVGGKATEWGTWFVLLPTRLNRDAMEEALASALRHDPENGWLLYFYAHMRINRPLGEGEQQADKIAEAETNFARSLTSASFLPATQRAARYWLVHCEFDLAEKNGQGARRESCLANMRTLLQVADPTASETEAFWTRAREFGERDLALQLAAHRARCFPKDQAAAIRWIESLTECGLFERAIETARTCAQQFPKNARFPELESTARSKFVAAATAAQAPASAR